MVVGAEKKQYRISPAGGVIEPEPRDWRIADIAVAALRSLVAALFILHGLREQFGVLLPGNTPWLGAPGFFTDRWMAAMLEISSGLLLGAGLFFRWVTLGLALFVAVSPLAPERMQGHWMFGGIELIVLYTGVLLAMSLMGPGVFSVDAWREARKRPKGSGPRVRISPWIKRQYRHRELTR